MANGGRIDFTVGYKLDKTGLNEIKKELSELSKISATQIKLENPTLNMNQAMSAMQKVRQSINEIQPALNKAFDPTTGILNLQKLNSSLKNLDLKRIQSDFAAIGPRGQQAFLNITKAALTTKVTLNQTSSILDKMGQTFVNTLKWGISSSIMNKFVGSVQQAYGYVQHLDTSLNDIRIVTGKSADEMERFAEKANNSAKALGQSTTAYTEAALIYYQQGLSDEEAQARAETTLKAANVTGQSGREVSEQLTAVWNGYKVTAEETEMYVDKLAAVAASTASDLEELSTGMSKVASAANNMGVDIDQLNAQLATIISVTRQAPETAGTALKTIYARMEDLKISGEDEDGVKLGEVSSTLEAVGISVMDTSGDLRDLGEVIEEVASKWDTWTSAQQNAIAQALAGKRQYNNLLALFDNWDMYTEALETSRNSLGTLQQQQDIYMESTAAHLQTLKTQAEDFYDSLINTKDINTALDGLTAITKLLTNMLDSIGGGKTLITGLLALLGTTFSKQVAQAFGPMIINMQNAKKNAEVLQQLLNNINEQQQRNIIGTKTAEAMTNLQKEVSQYWHLMSSEEIDASKQIIRDIGTWENKKEVISETNKQLQDYINTAKVTEKVKTNANSDQLGLAGSSANLNTIKFLEKQKSIVEQSKASFQDLSNSMAKFNDKINGASKVSEKDLEKMTTALEKAKKQVRILQDAANKGLIDPKIAKEASNQIKAIETRFNVMSKELKQGLKNTTFKTSMKEGLLDLGSSLTGVSEKFDVFIQNLKNGTATEKEATEAIEELKRGLKLDDLEIERKTQAVSQLVGGLSSLAFSIQSIGHIGEIITDDDLSTGQKFGQIISSLLITLPMLMNGVKSVSTAVQTLTGTESLAAAASVIWGQVTSVLTAETFSLAGAIEAVSLAIESIPVIGWIIAAITIAVAGLTAIIKGHQKALENDAKAAQDNAKAQQEIIEKTKSEKEAVDELANSYQNLLDQRNEDGQFSEEQRDEVYKLVKAYGDQSLIIQALAGDYDKLEESIRGAQNAANDKLVQDLEKGKQDNELALESSIIANAKSSQRDNAGFDFSGLGGVVDKHEDFRKDLQKLLGYDDSEVDYDVIDRSGHISYDNLIKLLTSETEDLKEFLDKYKDLKATTQIRELLDENDTLVRELKQGEDELTQAKLNQLGYNNISDIETISNVGEYSNKVAELAKKAFEEEHLVDSYEEGEQWASEFLSGYSDKMLNYDKKNEVANAIFDTIIPSDEELEERSKEVAEKLTQYGQGGNVDLLNRPLINNEDGTYSTVSTKTVANEDGSIAINFTPYIVDENGNLIDTLSPEALEQYGQEVIAGVHGDDKGLQIGVEFTGEDAVEKAERASQVIHELQAEYYAEDMGYDPYQDFIDEVYEGLGDVDEASLSFIADHIEIFTALKEEGWSVEEILENLQADLDIATNEDHVIKIDAVIDKKFAEKEVTELFEDSSFDIGISQDEFNMLAEDEKYFILNQQREKEIQQIQQMSEAEKKAMEERAEALNNQIAKEEEWISTQGEDWEKAKQEYQSFIDLQLEGHQDDLGNKYGNFESVYSSMGFEEDDLDNFKAKYIETMEAMGEAYAQAEEQGKDTSVAVSNYLDTVDEDMRNFITEMNYSTDWTKDQGEATLEMAQNWSKGKKNLNALDKEITEHTDNLEKLEKKREGIIDTTIDHSKRLANLKVGLSAINTSIDSVQKSYQALQSIVEDYNEDGKLSLDNLQALIEMDNAYAASLDITNGKMSINNETMRSAIDAKIRMAKVTLTEAYMAELEAIANGEATNANKEFIESEIYSQQAINGTIEAANRGVAALMNYAGAKAAAQVDKAATEQATKAYYNKMQMLDNIAGQSTSEILGKADKSSSKSSGSSKAEEADHEDYLEREADLYKTINEELDQIESTLSRIQTVADHKWGVDAQKALEKENKLLDKQLEKLEEKKALQQQDLSHRRGVLESIGVAFSEDGSAMLNSESVLDAMYANYNSMVDAYNNMSKAEQETYKAQLEAEQKRIEDIESKIDDYESGFSDYQDTLDKLLDAHYAQIENEVKLFNNMVDVHLELNDAHKEWDKFWSEVVEDVQDNDFAGQIAASMKQLKTLVGLGGDVKESDVYTLTQHLMDTTTQVNAQIASANRGGEDSIFGDDTALSKENLQNYIQQLMDAVTAAKEALDNIAENYLKILDDAQDKIDKQIEGWESINDHLEHNLELIKLISGDKAFDALDKQFEKQYENNLNLLTTQKASKDFWAGEVDRYEKLMASVDKNSKQYQTYEEAYNKSVENYRKAVNDLDKTVETSIKNLQDWRKNAVDNVMDTLDKAMSKGMGLSDMEKQWKLINDYSSRYLDNVERALGMEEYTNILDDAVNATGLTAANQEKLNNFREIELAQLNQKARLTQYDLDESKARLEILKQQMALEDARNNKSNMRLRRDSQGNYTYQYTGDQEAEDQAEGGLLSARREWYELVKARQKEIGDSAISTAQDVQQAIQDMQAAQDANDEIAYANAKERYDMALEAQKVAMEEAEKAKRDFFKGTSDYFAEVENAEILPMWEATIEEMVNEWSDGGEESFIGACTIAIQNLEAIQDEYVTRTHQVLNTAGVDYNKLKEKGIDPTDESLKDLVMDNEDFATILEEVNDLLSEQEGNLRDAEAAYNDLGSAAESALRSAQIALEELSRTAIQTVQDIQAAISAANTAYSYGSSTLGSLGSSSGGGGGNLTGGPGNMSNTPKINVYKEGQTYGNYYYAYYNGKKYTTTANDETDAMSQILDQIRKENPSFSGTSIYTPAGNGNLYSLKEKIRRSRAQNNKWGSGYATGGYTGDWDQGIPGTDNGRLAILHQKELVLNANDTSNMLKAVEVVRQLFSSNIISGIAQSLLSISNEGLLGGISSGVQSISSNISNSVASNNSNITINADFSGVHDADEIYEAFTQLQNTALQSNFSTAPHLNISY